MRRDAGILYEMVMRCGSLKHAMQCRSLKHAMPRVFKRLQQPVSPGIDAMRHAAEMVCGMRLLEICGMRLLEICGVRLLKICGVMIKT